MSDRGIIYAAGYFIVWLTEAINALPPEATDARSGLETMRKELIREGTRPVDVVKQDAA